MIDAVRRAMEMGGQADARHGFEFQVCRFLELLPGHPKWEKPRRSMIYKAFRDLVANQGLEPRTCGL